MKKLVSICCLCFNHDKYLRDSLDSFLNQTGDFDIEIVILDDCSTDNSLHIITEYQKKHPGIIKLISPGSNIYQRGYTGYFNIIQESKGEFLFFCEGDDYWIDEKKIAKQLSFLDENESIDLVFHPSMTKKQDYILDLNYGFHGKEKLILPFNNVLLKSGSYMAMASICARKHCFTPWFELDPLFFSKNMWHSTIQILGSFRGGAGYLPEKMSVYRSMHEGSWTKNMATSSISVINDFNNFILRNRRLDEIFNFKYSNILDEVLIKRLMVLGLNKIVPIDNKLKLLEGVPIRLSLSNKCRFYYLMARACVVRYVKK